MIKINNVSKIYETKEGKNPFKKVKVRKTAVDKLNMQIEKGKIIGLLGVNGAGKTTTIKMISTLLEPTFGEITIDEEDAVKDRMRIKKRVNMIAGGERMIYWRLSGRENLKYFGQLYGIEKKVLESRIDELVKLVGLENSIDIPVERYSKGMKQRLQIARGMINDPDYLLLDEPTLGLDAPIAKEIRTYIRKLADEKGKGILLTSHYIPEVEALCDYIYVLHEGKLLYEGTSKTLSSQVFDTKRYVFETNLLSEGNLVDLKLFANDLKADMVSSFENGVHRVVIESRNDCHKALMNYIHKNRFLIHNFRVEEADLESSIIELSRRLA